MYYKIIYYKIKKQSGKGFIMKLSKLLERMSFTCIQGEMDIEVTKLIYDSRKVTEGCVFVCISESKLSSI